MNKLEQQFHDTLIQGYKDAKQDCRYNATYYLRMLSEIGGLATARQLINADDPSEGSTKLWECERLDLTVEAVALNPIYRELFSEDELARARERLQEYGYDVP